ncbi:hypothetical protein KI387_021564, partial [Taxus chinensis]
RVKIQGESFLLMQCHWHHPSEDTINGKHYALELHMVHKSGGNTGVIAVIYSIGSADPFLTTLDKYIKQLDSKTQTTVDSVDAKTIGIRRDAAYFRYYGSLTTPPYTELVQWTVISQVRTASQAQVNTLKAVLNG